MTSHEQQDTASAGQCPAWCITDHGKYTFHAANAVTGMAPDYRTWMVRRVLFPVDERPHIEVAAAGVMSVYAGSADVGELAAIIEGLADATPEQHRQLAEAIRQETAALG